MGVPEIHEIDWAAFPAMQDAMKVNIECVLYVLNYKVAHPKTQRRDAGLTFFF